MWVEAGEVEFSGDEKEDGADRFEPAVAAGLALGGLEQAVERLDEAVGLPGAHPGGDSVDALLDAPGLVERLREFPDDPGASPLAESLT